MATSALSTDPSKINLYGAEPTDVESYQKSLEDSISALQQRYANPNWFNVAAGFFKPQLGGFAASLGSAAQAMGENVEKERETQLPIAQMRAQLAASKIAMGQGSAAAQELAKWKASAKPMDEATLTHITGLAPNSPAAAAAKAAYDAERANLDLESKKQGLDFQQQQQQLALLQQQYAAGSITRQEYQAGLALLKQYGPTAEKRVIKPTDTANTSVLPPGAIVAPAAVPVAGAAAPVAGAAAPVAGAAAPVAGAVAPVAGAAAPTFNFEFSTQTPDEIRRVLSTSPNVDAAERNKVLAGYDSYLKNIPYESKTKISSGFGAESGLTPDQIKDAVKPQEEFAQARFKKLQAVGAPEAYVPVERAIANQISLIQNNKKAVARVSAVLAGSPLLAALNEGVGISINGLSANIRAPIETYIRSSFKPAYQDLAMAMANNYAIIAVARQQVDSVNPNAVSNKEAGLYAGLTPDMNTKPQVALRALAHLREDRKATRAQYEQANSILMGNHPELALAKDEPARYSSVMNHPSVEKIAQPFTKKHEEIESAFQRHLTRGAKNAVR